MSHSLSQRKQAAEKEQWANRETMDRCRCGCPVLDCDEFEIAGVIWHSLLVSAGISKRRNWPSSIIRTLQGCRILLMYLFPHGDEFSQDSGSCPHFL